MKCKYCNKKYKAKTERHVYCSKKCAALFHYYKRPKQTLNRNCDWCNKPFNTTRSIKKFCSNKCASKSSDNAARYKKLYKINLEDYDFMFDAQQGKCAICGGITPDKVRLNVDHCHNTGKVRGLLCSGCNLMLGRLKDNVQALKRAIKYLEN